MRKSRYSEEQIVAILKESEAGVPTAELCRKHGISDADVLPLEGEIRRSGSERGASASSTGRREPQAQAAGSRTGVGHRRSQGGSIKKVVSPQARRESVAVFRTAADSSERHACGQLEVLRAMLRYRQRETRFAEANDRLRVRLRELAEDRRHWSYRRLHVLLRREGWTVNSERVYRIYAEEKLMVRRRKRRRRICAKARVLLAAPGRKNETWTMDFLQDALDIYFFSRLFIFAAFRTVVPEWPDSHSELEHLNCTIRRFCAFTSAALAHTCHDIWGAAWSKDYWICLSNSLPEASLRVPNLHCT
jgi:putative transposase